MTTTTYDQMQHLLAGIISGGAITFLFIRIFRSLSDGADRKQRRIDDIDRRLQKVEMKDYLKELGLCDVKPTRAPVSQPPNIDDYVAKNT